MTTDESPSPHRQGQRIGQNIKEYHPIRNLFLLDVLQDRESRPLLLWAGFILLLGVVIYRWLEGWSVIDALYFCVITLATIGIRRPDPDDAAGQALYRVLRHQRHRHPGGIVRPHSRSPLA